VGQKEYRLKKMRFIELQKSEKIGTILLNRPEVKNAFNPELIAELTSAIRTLQMDKELAAMVIRGKNGTFSSGADLKWLKESGSKSFDQNVAENRLISDLMETLIQVQVPLISVAEGLVYGGALGILGCSDWVLAEQHTLFAFSEVRLGLAPAIIMPYVIKRSNSIKIKQFMLTGQQFDAWEALDNGLADEVGENQEIESILENLFSTFQNLPAAAVREIKRLWLASQTPINKDIKDLTINSLATLKQSGESQDLLQKFLNKKS
jgi:methylglutaconyl-CoA hydratase